MLSLFLLMLMLGVANWFATTLVVESEIFRPVREWVGSKAVATGKNAAQREAVWRKVAYLVGCHMCTGTWVALAMALFVPPVVNVPVASYLLTALVIKGIGHLVLLLVNMGNARIELDRAETIEASMNALPDLGSVLDGLMARERDAGRTPTGRDRNRNPVFGDVGRAKFDNSRGKFEPLPDGFNIPETKF